MNARVARLIAATLAMTASMARSAEPSSVPSADPNVTAAPPGFRPFTVDHHGRVDSAADVSFLLNAPAGKDGFITVKSMPYAHDDEARTGYVRGTEVAAVIPMHPREYEAELDDPPDWYTRGDS